MTLGGGIGKADDIRDGDDRSSGREILVKKESECGIRAPVSQPFVFYSFHCAVLDTLSCTVRYCSELYYNVRFCIAFNCTEQYLLYYIALFCTVFYCITFYFIELHWIVVDKILKSHSLQRDYTLEFPVAFLRLIHRIVPAFKTSLELSN